jgi:uncharacterized membrane protein
MLMPESSRSAPLEAATSDRTPIAQTLSTRIHFAFAHGRLEYVFLLVALAWGVAQVFLVPPLQVPDEGDHWFRAWAITDGQFTADRQGMLTVPASFKPAADLYLRLAEGGLPTSLEGQPGFSSYEALFNSGGAPGTVRVASRVLTYGPVGYLPQALGVGLGRLAGAPPLTCFYLARLANLFAALALMFFAIRLAPFGKQLFVLIALLPMTMFEIASVSCDALTIAGAMFFIALTLRAGKRAMLRKFDVVILLAAAGFLLNVKPGYWALILLVLLITPERLGGRGRYTVFVLGNFLVVVGAFLLVFFLTATDARVQAGAGPQVQLLFIAQQPVSFLQIVSANLQSNLVPWTLESIGALGWLRITLPSAFYLMVFAAGLAFLIWTRDDDARIRVWQGALLALVGVAVFLTLAVALYAFLEPTGSDRVFFQGRYLAPIWLLLLLSTYAIPFARRHLDSVVVITVVLVMMVQNLGTLISIYRP